MPKETEAAIRISVIIEPDLDTGSIITQRLHYTDLYQGFEEILNNNYFQEVRYMAKTNSSHKVLIAAKEFSRRTLLKGAAVAGGLPSRG